MSSRLNPRRLRSKAKAKPVNPVQANLASPVMALALDKARHRTQPLQLVTVVTRGPNKGEARIQPPQGAVFTAKVIRPWLNKRFKRWGKS